MSDLRWDTCWPPALGLLLCCALLWWLPQVGNLLLVLIAGLVVLGAVRARLRQILWRLALVGLCAACLSLVMHLLADHFQLRYIWLYSSATLPAYLKVANLWGGDEGTVLLLATLCMGIGVRNAALPGWAGCANALVAAWYTLTAAGLGPFTATPADWLAAQASQGMNAHLQTIWMAFHAPLIIAAYAWAIAPAGAALDALARTGDAYGALACTYGRRAWLVLTAGIGMGMVWALEDFTFGQLWHWDPVQTAAFAVWAMLGAVLHGARRWRPQGRHWRALPLFSLLTAALACIAMSVTRSEVLASSHRYIGTTSWLGHLALAGGILGLMLWFAWRAFRRPAAQARPVRRSASDWGLDMSMWLFAVAALLAVGQLLSAHVGQWLALEKASELKPFFETLAVWASAEELAGLRRAFDHWDVDGHALGKWLMPVIGLLGLLGGWVFLRRSLPARYAGLITLGMALWVALTAWRGAWLTSRYTGEGVLSQRIVQVLPWLDAALLAGMFLLLACLAWGMRVLWRSRRLGTLRHTAPLALIHGGAMVALAGGLLATALNTYMPINIAPASSPQAWHRVADQLQVRVLPVSSQQNFSGYQAVAQVQLRSDDQVIAGHALFQDRRALPPAYQGPVRQLCEILDYRYARHVGDPGYVLHPFIVRGWAQDLQVWVPASPRLMTAAGGLDGGDAIQGVIVVRRYPFVSLVWLGLLAMVLGMLVLPGQAHPARQWSQLSQS
ncbi:MAG: cytochrome c biogenesis protein CcsA [Pseudomonas palmensis]|uniref:cytochrome c biogenesis protein CcsA n=1 Tax=Pseudomonas palmensis TaxID=2815362 RepID=UPI003D0BEAE4